MDLLRVCLTSFLSLAIFFCTTAFAQAQSNVERNKTKHQQRISELSYQLMLSISEKPEFSAISKIEFNLVDSQRPLSLALKQAQVHSFNINGHKIYPNYDGKHFQLNQRLLNNGSNSIEIHYSGTLAAQNSGLNRVVDPSDNRVYLYSNFNEDNASLLLPQFKQASLKASYQLSISAPKSWTLITTMKETEITEKGEFNLWQFPASPKLSAEQLPLYAGPFKVWQDKIQTFNLRLMTRQSNKETIDASLWFSITKDQLIDFTERFGTSYPYQKYDQIISPYNSSTPHKIIASAGMSSFYEKAIPSGSQVTETIRQSLISGISYGVASQWVNSLTDYYWSQNGVLTKDTMLDSLALYMTTQSLAATGEFPQIWHQFYLNNKRYAYAQDSLLTTYQDTDKHTLTDPYKGVAILKQLEYQFGTEKFKLALTTLLQSHARNPVTLAAFITELEISTKRDLNHWDVSQLQQVGVNSIKVDFRCSNNRVTAFSLLQSPTNNKHTERQKLPEQKVTLGLYTKGRSQLHRNLDVAVTYWGAKTDIKRLIGVRCPDLVYPNEHDWGYVKVVLDETSAKTAMLELNKVQDPLLKSMLWQSLWESVLNGELPLDQYLGAVFINLPQEQDSSVLVQVLQTLIQSKAYLNLMYPIHLSYTRRALKGLEQMSLRKSMFYQDKPALQQIWFNAYIQFSSSHQALEHLIQLIEGSTKINGLTLNQETRWKIIHQINRYDHIKSKDLLLAEKKKDSSQTGVNASISASISRPETNLKERWLTRIHSNERFDDLTLDAVIPYLYPSEQKQQSAITSTLRIDNLGELDNRKHAAFMQRYVSYLIPTQCDRRGIVTLDKALIKYSAQLSQESDKPTLSKVTYNALRKAHQEELRCIRIKDRLLQ